MTTNGLGNNGCQADGEMATGGMTTKDTSLLLSALQPFGEDTRLRKANEDKRYSTNP